MKTQRFLIVTAILLFAQMSFLSPQLSANEIMIPLNKAIVNPSIVKTLHTQSDRIKVMSSVDAEFITIPVKYKTDVYLVYATLREWQAFFNDDANNSPTGRNDVSPPGLLRSARYHTSSAKISQIMTTDLKLLNRF